MLRADDIAKHLEGKAGKAKDPLQIIPQPDLEALGKSGSASIDLRLGRWFVSLRESRTVIVDILRHADGNNDGLLLGKLIFVPFGKQFNLHPGKFVLGTTLEWVRLPADLVGYITGKSSWGRRGLIIETAAGVHPGFAGCLTLEISNLGEVAIAIRPGLSICQLFFHPTSTGDQIDKSPFVGLRRPNIGAIRPDDIAKKLAQAI